MLLLELAEPWDPTVLVTTPVGIHERLDFSLSVYKMNFKKDSIQMQIL